MIGTYRPGEYEYVGVPLDHSQTEEESSGPSTAEIIANQSQDYVDEKLAEYQATIQQLQSEYFLATVYIFARFYAVLKTIIPNLSLFLLDKFMITIKNNRLQVIISINHIAVCNQCILKNYGVRSSSLDETVFIEIL